MSSKIDFKYKSPSELLNIYNSDEFERLYFCNKELGVSYSSVASRFRVWAPSAEGVSVRLYKTGCDSEQGSGIIGEYPMAAKQNGLWEVVLPGDYKNIYYTYIIYFPGWTNETADIYAKAAGVNGNRSMIVDLPSTNPAGWYGDSYKRPDEPTKSIIWEIHVKDFSFSENSGITKKYRGKYPAFTVDGTTLNSNGINKTCLSYLKELGITHVHLLPVFDYASVDESATDSEAFNWGYDPKNYNVPEGSLSSNPFDGNVRIKEFKQMILALHNAGIGVIMDVVYNHTYDTEHSFFNLTVPYYYYRQFGDGRFSNGSGCGNETASERCMFRKYMIDSVLYWAEEYHIDGFRFDLMGLHDTETMNFIRYQLDRLPDGKNILMYGEPWTADTSPMKNGYFHAVKDNLKQLSPRIAVFSDNTRDTIKGSVFELRHRGFINGNCRGNEANLKAALQAHSTDRYGYKYANSPSQIVSYTSAHDNYTLWDKLLGSVKKGGGYDIYYWDLVAMNRLAATILATSQGIMFFQAGEEFARTKYGDHNSYRSRAEVNKLDWQKAKDYSNLVEFYRELITIRKGFSAFTDPTPKSAERMCFSEYIPDGTVAFTLTNRPGAKEKWDIIAVAYNGNQYDANIRLEGETLPEKWKVLSDGQQASFYGLSEIEGNEIRVPAFSAVILGGRIRI